MLLLRIGQSAAARGWALSPVRHHIIRTRLTSFTTQCRSQRCHILVSRQNLLAAVSRLFSRDMRRLPLDTENLSAQITKDVTVFTYKNKRYFLLLTIFGSAQLLFWANIAVFIKYDPTIENSSKPRTTSQKSYRSSMGKFYAENRTKIAVTCLSLGKCIWCWYLVIIFQFLVGVMQVVYFAYSLVRDDV